MTAISSAEVLFKYSVAAPSGNSAGSGQGTSLGDKISTTQWVGGTVDDLFDDVTADENTASATEYRCIFVHNANATNDLQNPVIYIASQTAGGADIAIAVDNKAASPIASASAQAAAVTNSTTAPTGVGAFSAPTTAAAGLALGTIPAGYCRAVWVRRKAANTAALDVDSLTLTVTGETSAA